jgi:hypothetical protein
MQHLGLICVPGGEAKKYSKASNLREPGLFSLHFIHENGAKKISPELEIGKTARFTAHQNVFGPDLHCSYHNYEPEWRASLTG